MTQIDPLIPRQPVPNLDVATVGGGTWRLGDQKPEHFTLVVFYRGLHCPICRAYLADLNRKVDEFEKRGVAVAVVSSDTQDRAEQATTDWGLDKLTMGYGLDLDNARSWGLYISTGRGKTSVGIEALRIDAEITAILAVRIPDDDIATVSEGVDRWQRLVE